MGHKKYSVLLGTRCFNYTTEEEKEKKMADEGRISFREWTSTMDPRRDVRMLRVETGKESGRN